MPKLLQVLFDMNLKKAALIIFVILLVDQISKLYIKTNFVLGESIEVFHGLKYYSLKMRELHGVPKFQENMESLF